MSGTTTDVRTGSRWAPVVAAVAASVAATGLSGVLVVFAAVSDCSFAGGTCGPDSPPGAGPVAAAAVVAVIAAWASAAWVARRRASSRPTRSLYLVGVGVPAAAALVLALVTAAALSG